MRPTWKHFLPRVGMTRNGSCFDLLTHSNWRGAHRVGLVFYRTRLPQPAHAIDGHAVFCLTERLRWVFDPLEYRREVRSLKQDAARFEANADELFVPGTIDNLAERLRGIVLVETGARFGTALLRDIEAFAKRHGVAVVTLPLERLHEARALGLQSVFPSLADSQPQAA